MRIGIGGFAHETNVFCNIPVTEKTLETVAFRGQQLLDRYRGVQNGIGGLIDEAQALGITLVPACYAFPGPSGPTERAAYEHFRDELVDRLWQAHCEQPLDGICLSLHGAAVALGYDDPEADLLACLRVRFGRQMPISIALDLHANVSEEMVALADMATGYKCYPHVDYYDTNRRAMNLLHRAIVTGKKPHCTLIRLPWLIAPAFGLTLSGPGHEIQQFMARQEAQDAHLLDATFFHGFSYADVSICGASVLTVADTAECANAQAERIAKFAWELRHSFQQPTNSAAQAMELALQAKAPVVINESSDNPGGGTPGDGTHLLREMLEHNVPGSAFAWIHDPEVIRQAVEAGVGSHICCRLGGKTDNLHGEPIELKDAYVKTITDGKFVLQSPMGKGNLLNVGTVVRLEVGNVSIVVTHAREQTKDDGPFRIVGIDWQQMRILGLKSTHHFRGWWQERAATIVPCDSPGVHSSDLFGFDFKGLNKSYFPFCDAQITL